MPTRITKRLTVALLIVAVAAIAVLLFDQLYFLRNDSAGEVLWNGDSAYLFMSARPRGYRVSYLAYPWVMLMQYLHAPPSPTDERSTLTVIQVTGNALERHVFELHGNTPDLLTPCGGNIYANCEGVLCKWDTDRFKPATAEERQKLEGINRLSAVDFDDHKGWSKRGIGSTAGGGSFLVQLGKGVSLSVKQGNVYKSIYDSASVELSRPGQPPQTLWYVDGKPRLVSKWQYMSTFH